MKMVFHQTPSIGVRNGFYIFFIEGKEVKIIGDFKKNRASIVSPVEDMIVISICESFFFHVFDL
jgi:hypothetical protein